MEDMAGSELPTDPAFYLLHCTSKPVGRYKRSILPHLLNAARALILRLWKQQRSPTLGDWLREASHLKDMEELTLSLHNREQAFWKTWYYWIEFQDTDRYKQALAL